MQQNNLPISPKYELSLREPYKLYGIFITYMNLSQISFRETILLVTIKPSVMKITIDVKPTQQQTNMRVNSQIILNM